jgi:hypothetical protein
MGVEVFEAGRISPINLSQLVFYLCFSQSIRTRVSEQIDHHGFELGAADPRHKLLSIGTLPEHIKAILLIHCNNVCKHILHFGFDCAES